MPYIHPNRRWSRTPCHTPFLHPGVSSNASAAPKRNILDGLVVSGVVATLEIPDIVPDCASTDAAIRNVECIGSFDWVDSKIPTIIVPSCPPEWMGDTKLPFTLNPDVPTTVPNHKQYHLSGPSYALLPVIQAADAMTKAVDWPSVDFIVSRNFLTKLLRWIRGSSRKDGGGWYDFRLDLELVGGKTVLFTRWDAGVWDGYSHSRSYGLNFEKATTSPAKGCDNGKMGHHRIVKYDFLGMTFVVRSQVDACLPVPPGAENIDMGGLHTVGQPSISNVAAPLSNLKLSCGTMTSPSPSPSQASPLEESPDTLRVIHAGREVPQDAIIELTTRSAYWLSNTRWGEIYPALYLSQTPHFYIGLQKRGTFYDIQKRTLEDKEFAAHKKEVDMSLRKLGEALKTIQKLALAAAEHGRDKRLSLVCVSGELKVYELVSMESCLPEGTRRRFKA
ncbi:hypothetical protein FA95DRAFT_1497226 [Auriscalpium vulgare]|uniref:Uncharacterized protein n=1 Tax=Auriscalpium vulgare TaxID=40419 RepID=A0ACB8RJN7_9AGAM|nr:hypothetical protein FA95DRAFT_1497226 [Auriscalpium vulgare]